MAETCFNCGDPIASDGYCAGCGRRPSPQAGPDDVFAARLFRGHFGYSALILAAVTLYSWGAVTRNFTDTEAGAAGEAWAGMRQGEGAGWWVVVFLTIALVTGARVLMTAWSAETPFRIAVWSALASGWIFGGFLGYKCASGATAARTEAERREELAEKTLKEVRDERNRLGRPVGAREIDYPALAQAGPPRVGPPRSDFLADASRNLLFELEVRKFQAQESLVKADSLRMQSRVLLFSLMAALGAVVSLLFLVACEQTWCGRSAAPVPPAGAKAAA